MSIPAFNDLVDTYVAYYESALGQSAPLTPKAFLRVLANVKALVDLGLYKLAAERAAQNLIASATGQDLINLGAEFGVTYQGAVAAELVLTCTGANWAVIPAGTIFIGDETGLRYYTQAEVTLATGTAAPTVTCYTAGVDGTMEVSDTLTLSSPIVGVDTAATVASVSVDGIDEEDEEVFRRRVLDAAQTQGGGSNLADFRIWGQETPGIVRVFPYTGVSGTELLTDGDMEASGVTAWTASNATLTKETASPFEGTRNLKIAVVAGGSAAYAAQIIIQQGHSYRITGQARSDGTATPQILFGAEEMWAGDTSTSWQAIDVTVLATSSTDPSVCFFVPSGGGTGDYVEFDDMSITEAELPGKVTVYAECDSSLDPDGIPDGALLADVRAYLLNDPLTGIARPSLGLIDANLLVEAITRISIHVEIRGLSIAAEHETQAKSDISTDLDAYLRNATPYIAGLDSASSQADQITDPLLSKAVQDILDSYGATCSGIGIGTTPGVFIASYSLGAGELAKLGSVTYV